jgi:hypothetical protein
MTSIINVNEAVGGRRATAVRPCNAWILQSGLGQDHDLASQLSWLLDFVEPRVNVLKALLPSCRIDLFCGFSSGSGQGGTKLDSGLLARLANLHLDLILDLYPPGPISDE